MLSHNERIRQKIKKIWVGSVVCVRLREAQICKCNVVLAIRVGRVCVYCFCTMSEWVSAPTSSCPIHSAFHSRHVLLFPFLFIFIPILPSIYTILTLFHFPHNPYFSTCNIVCSFRLFNSFNSSIYILNYTLISLTCSLNQHFICVVHHFTI